MPAIDQGVNFDRYMLVPRTLIFIVQGTSILLLKGSIGKRLWSGLYNGIGGHIEEGEDILTAAQRELFEETGLVSDDLYLCGVDIVNTGKNPGVCIYIFKGTHARGELSNSQEGSLEWISCTDLNSVPLVPDLLVFLPRILDMKPGDVPFSAYSDYDDNGSIQVRFGKPEKGAAQK